MQDHLTRLAVFWRPPARWPWRDRPLGRQRGRCSTVQLKPTKNVVIPDAKVAEVATAHPDPRRRFGSWLE